MILFLKNFTEINEKWFKQSWKMDYCQNVFSYFYKNDSINKTHLESAAESAGKSGKSGVNAWKEFVTFYENEKYLFEKELKDGSNLELEYFPIIEQANKTRPNAPLSYSLNSGKKKLRNQPRIYISF